ncbi:MAG: protease HtpX [Gammaproteobacteria bacterium]|nr:protease HtpX [Gammaproteobacteria bacterium]
MKRILLFVLTNLAVLALLSIVVFVIESVTGVRLGGPGYGAMLAFAAIFGFGGALISLAMSKWIAKRTMGVVVIETPSTEAEHWLVATVDRLAAGAQIGRPEVGVFESEEMNAFATGARRDAALVAVSTGLLRGMSRPQIEAVLGHEISHVANGDMVTLTLLQGVLNTFVIFLSRLIGNFVDRALLRNERDGAGLGYFVTTMVAQVVLGIFASLIVAAFSRYREFRADRGGARLAGREQMIGALEALKRSHGEPMPNQLQAFGINSGPPGALAGLFQSHPPLDARIAALRAG